jgi:hypothetical protein
MARAYPFHSYPLQSYRQAGIWWAIVEQHEDVISLRVLSWFSNKRFP